MSTIVTVFAFFAVCLLLVTARNIYLTLLFVPSGAKANKQRSVDDLRSVVHYLVDSKKYTTHTQLGLFGGGNGGLLIGGVMTTHPSTVAAVAVTGDVCDCLIFVCCV